MNNLLEWEDFFNENKSLEISNYKEAYRWVGQPGLFQYFYGDIKNLKDYVLALDPETDEDIEMPKNLPHRIDIMETSFEGGICMTVDPGYKGEPMNGEEIIRMVFDLEKMYKDLPKENFKNLLNNGEAEFRYLKDFKNWPKYLIRIDIDKEAFNKDLEDDFGVYRAIKKWIPKDIKVNQFKKSSEILGQSISNKLI